jgi:hypothetical protein
MADRPVSREEAAALTRYIQSLLNNQLKNICSLNGIRSTGVKSELQGRIRERECARRDGGEEAEIFPPRPPPQGFSVTRPPSHKAFPSG